MTWVSIGSDHGAVSAAVCRTLGRQLGGQLDQRAISGTAPTHSSFSGTRLLRSSDAGTPNRRGSAPGRNRKPTNGSRSRGLTNAVVSGPATTTRPFMLDQVHTPVGQHPHGLGGSIRIHAHSTDRAVGPVAIRGSPPSRGYAALRHTETATDRGSKWRAVRSLDVLSSRSYARAIGQTGSAQSMPSAESWRLSTLKVTVRGSSALMRTNDGHCLGPRSGCSARNARNFSASNSAPAREHQRGHHPIADGGVGYGVDRGLDNIGMAQHDSLDRCGAQVLAVDAHPVAQPSGEVDVAGLIAVGQIAAVVHAAGHPFGFGRLVVVVAAELSATLRIHQFADLARRARLAGVDVDDRDFVGQRAQ